MEVEDIIVLVFGIIAIISLTYSLIGILLY